MRVLLVHTNRERAPQPALPLGLCLVASSLEQAGFETRVLDLCFSRDPGREFDRAITEFSPYAVGLSLRNLDNGDYLRPRSYVVEMAGLAQQVRARHDGPIIIGGPAVSIAPRALLELLPADYAVAGDGEAALPSLLECLSAGRGPATLPGVCVRGGSGPVLPAAAPELETLPFAQLGRWLDLGPYFRLGAPLPIQTKRGCELQCIYCTYRHIEGGCYRRRHPTSVATELREARRKWHARSFEVVDATFNHPLDHALALCEAIAQANLGAELQTAGLTPASLSLELLRLMKKAGFTNVVCTPDSGSETMLLNLRKGFGPDQVAQAASWAREADLPVLWSFLFGGPGENDQTVRATLRLLASAFGPRDRFLCTLGLRVYPGTELARLAVEEGVLRPDAKPLHPAFYFSPAISPERVFAMLESSPMRSRMIHLSALHSPLVGLGLRLRRALRLPGPPWRYLPLYNRLARGPRPRPRSGRTQP